MDLDQILSVIENPTRRMILRKLSTDTNYPLQLSRELNISQQAIMKHLKVLEKAGFVTSFEERSDKGGPPRKIYEPKRKFSIRIDIGPNTYDEKVYRYEGYGERRTKNLNVSSYSETRVVVGGLVTGEMKEDVVAALPAYTDPNLETTRRTLERSLEEDDPERSLIKLKKLINHLNSRIDHFETKRKQYIELRERIYEEVNKIISEISDDYLQKDLYSLFVKSNIDDINLLSEHLNVRKKLVENLLRGIMDKRE